MNLLENLRKKKVDLKEVSVKDIQLDVNFSGRINLTLENCLQDDDFLSLYNSIKMNGLQEPIDLLLENNVYTNLSGYRRCLAIIKISQETNEDLTIMAYVYTEITELEKVKLACIKNSARKNLSLLEMYLQYTNLSKLIPEANHKDIVEYLGFMKHTSNIIADFGRFYNQLTQYLNNNNNLVQDQAKYSRLKQVQNVINYNQIKVNHYQRIVKLDKEELEYINKNNKNIFDVQCDLFHILINGKDSFLKKKEIKAEYFTKLQVEYESDMNFEMEKINQMMPDDFQTDEPKENQTQKDFTPREKDNGKPYIPEPEKRLGPKIEIYTDIDHNVSNLDKGRRYLDSIYETLNTLLMDKELLRKTLYEVPKGDFDFGGMDEYIYENRDEYFSNLKKMLIKFTANCKTLENNALKATKHDSKPNVKESTQKIQNALDDATAELDQFIK
jgi:hypothetical protein